MMIRVAASRRRMVYRTRSDSCLNPGCGKRPRKDLGQFSPRTTPPTNHRTAAAAAAEVKRQPMEGRCLDPNPSGGPSAATEEEEEEDGVAAVRVTYRDLTASDLLFLCCCGLCCVRRATRTLAFWPPCPPTYSLESLPGGRPRLSLRPTSFCPYTVFELEHRYDLDVFKVEQRFGNSVVCAHFTFDEDARYTIIKSHMNGVDVGQEIRFAVELGLRCGCNVLVYDYSGYGESTGTSSEENICADLNAVFDELLRRYGLSAADVVLYGQSLGSVPTVALASRVFVAGVILCSPLFSALKILFSCATGSSPLDSFANSRKMLLISSPVLIIHGTADRLIRIEDVIALYRRCPTGVAPLWLVGAGHGNLELFAAFYQRIQRFLELDLALRELGGVPRRSGRRRPPQTLVSVQI